jgi:hypothetical protein
MNIKRADSVDAAEHEITGETRFRRRSEHELPRIDQPA